MASTRRKPNVTKATGELEPYSREKLRRSLERSGAEDAVIRDVLRMVEARMKDGMTTRALYKLAHGELRRSQRPAAARYSLRRAIQALGPSGYPFERLVAALFSTHGYATQVGRIVQGCCIQHEVDVIAERDGERIFAECKYHYQPGYRTDVKVALYVRARALDISERTENGLSEFWLITNTKFTTDAARYGECAGLRLLGWEHPTEGSLQQRLEHAGVLPVTCLSSLRATAKKRLLEAGAVTTNEILERPEVLGEVGLRDSEVRRVLAEASLLQASANGHVEFHRRGGRKPDGRAR